VLEKVIYPFKLLTVGMHELCVAIPPSHLLTTRSHALAGVGLLLLTPE